MKKYKTKPKSELYEVIIPFEKTEDDDGFFDDCPLCQQLKQQIKNGEVESVPIQFEVDDVN
jgi:hypothetical protein